MAAEPISRGQVFIRAMDPDGRWHSADVLDLEEESFRRWVFGFFVDAQLVVSLRPEAVDVANSSEPMRCRCRKERD